MKTVPTPLTKEHPNKRDSEQVRVLATMGASPEFIAHEIKLPLTDLLAHYKEDLEKGPEEGNARVAQAFFNMAISEEFPAVTIAWMKMRAHWSDAPPQTSTQEDEELASADAASARDRLAAALKNRPDVLQKLIS